MNAHQQLVELNAAIAAHCRSGLVLDEIKASRLALALISDYGPALAELIEMTRLLAYAPLRSGEKADATVRLAAALRKLTQDA